MISGSVEKPESRNQTTHLNIPEWFPLHLPNVSVWLYCWVWDRGWVNCGYCSTCGVDDFGVLRRVQKPDHSSQYSRMNPHCTGLMFMFGFTVGFGIGVGNNCGYCSTCGVDDFGVLRQVQKPDHSPQYSRMNPHCTCLMFLYGYTVGFGIGIGNICGCCLYLPSYDIIP